MIAGRDGFEMPALGLGTWRMGEDPRRRRAEVDALRLGLDLGVRLIDTAEMYGDGGAERIVGEAVQGRRDEVQIVSKVLPHNASRTGTIHAAERSLEALGCERIDLYLLHWPGPHPLEATYEAFEQLVAAGKIGRYGVSNFDTAQMRRSERTCGGDRVVANQVLYNLERRGVEHDLLPWCRTKQVLVMAYSPLEQGRLGNAQAMSRVSRRHGCEPSQVALAWTLRLPGVVSIPKAVRPEHVRQNVAALDLRLTDDDLAELDRAFPPPTGESPLEVL